MPDSVLELSYDPEQQEFFSRMGVKVCRSGVKRFFSVPKCTKRIEIVMSEDETEDSYLVSPLECNDGLYLLIRGDRPHWAPIFSEFFDWVKFNTQRLNKPYLSLFYYV